MATARIELSSGEFFTLPDGKVPSIEVIAASLSKQCRFTGHCRTFYSVAEHSVLCMLLAQETGIADPLECLLHDAHEALLGDMAAPWKPLIKGYGQQEVLLEQKLRDKFDVPRVLSHEAKLVDWYALFIEAWWLMPSKGEDWEDPLNVRHKALQLMQRTHWKVACLEPAQAEAGFLRAYKGLV
jgi:hypothetical protein